MSKCDLIRDLLPLYVDGAASKESARAVEEHVATCYECRRALQDMRAPTPSPAPDEEDMSFAVSLGAAAQNARKAAGQVHPAGHRGGGGADLPWGWRFFPPARTVPDAAWRLCGHAAGGWR